MRDIPVVGTFIAVCVLMFLMQQSGGEGLVAWMGLWPLGMAGSAMGAAEFHPWQLITYGFLHATPLHIFLNLYALWLFGAPLERRWGSQHFAAYLMICIIGAGLTHLIVAEFELSRGMPPYPVIGASGGVFGLLLAFGYLFPNQRLLLLIPPIPIKARWFVIGYGVIELVAGVTGSASGIAHFAHLGGMLTGYLLLRSVRWLY